mmetsp:Transcript_6774/g.25599  ORF Transcript_6774/g.25599 Transcript_6774/m.25599 type:complete len:251 (-) Transcript_6774:212-964(-)
MLTYVMIHSLTSHCSLDIKYQVSSDTDTDTDTDTAHLILAPSGTSASATHGPAAHPTFFPSYVAHPFRTLSFSFTKSQNLLLHSLGYPAAPGAMPSHKTSSPICAPSGTPTSRTCVSPPTSASVARIIASLVCPASFATFRFKMHSTILDLSSSSGTNFRKPVMTCFTEPSPSSVLTCTLQQYSLSEFSTCATSITFPITSLAFVKGSSSDEGCGVFGAFSFFSFLGCASPEGLGAPPLVLITGLSIATM